MPDKSYHFPGKRASGKAEKDVMTIWESCQTSLGNLLQNPKKDFYIFYKIVDCD